MNEIMPTNTNKYLQAPGPVAELVEAWRRALLLRVDAGELASNTAAAYIRGASKFLTWCDSEHVASVDGDTLRRWKAAQLGAGKKPATVNAWLAGVKALFAWAVETHRLQHNPAENVKGATRKGTTKKHARESLTDLEVKRVLAMPDSGTKAGKRDRAILALMVYTAARSVEVCRADLANLKTEAGRLVLYVTGKGHTEADELLVLANQNAQNALYDWLAVRGEQPGALFTSLSDRNSGERLSLRALRGMVKHYFRLAGVRGNKTAHSLRHTAITKIILKGGSIQKAQSVARHKSVDTTMIYFHEVDRLSDPGEAFIDYGD